MIGYSVARNKSVKDHKKKEKEKKIEWFKEKCKNSEK